MAMSKLDVKFADMPEPMRDYWIGWACGHDWSQDGRPYYDTDKELVTFCVAFNRDGSRYVERAVHRTPRELRDWAGY
jgi:hypothetical protein